ncbi:hypothetical protein ACFXKJ_41620 [Kitasatospora indigofera]|uniref:hypothetical protein n=1 Tax=Kitasatospora indigofera TaxID=67307 RepID=UPI003679BF2C
MVRRALLSMRAALVLLLGMLTGIGAGLLSAAGGTGPAQCVLYGLGAFGMAVPFFDRLVGGPSEDTPESEQTAP